jgi:cell division protein FtsL
MAVIKKEDLIVLYSELDNLKIDKKKLQAGFVELKLKSNKLEKQTKRSKIIIIILIVAFIISLFFLFFNYTKSKTFQENTAENQLVLLESIKKLSSLQFSNVFTGSESTNPEVIYSVQLGVYRKAEIKFNHKENTNFRVIEAVSGSEYPTGTFLSYKTATTFKNQIKKIGLRDALRVTHNKNQERINIKEALVLGNQKKYFK